MKIRKKSVVVRVNFMISVIIFCMIVMLVFSCLSAMKTVWKKSMRTYQSMGEYYAGDVASNLKNILEYLLRIHETADYYGLLYYGQNREFVNNQARQRLYNQLNEDILIYRSADYFFTFKDAYTDIMLIQSPRKTVETSNLDFVEEIRNLLQDRAEVGSWELSEIDGHQYLIRTVSQEEAGIGCAVSVERLIAVMQSSDFADYFVSYSKIQKNSCPELPGNDLKIDLLIDGTDAAVTIMVPSVKLYEEIEPLVKSSICFVVILLIMLPVLYIAMYYWFTEPVKRIAATMQKIDENGINLKMPDMGNMEEYAIVGKNFNNMMEKIKELKIDIYEKEKRQKDLYEQYARLQINPHFFLNSLNTVYLLNKRKNSLQVQLMLTYLINYFKSVFSRQGDMVLLKEEINFTLNYMAVQKLRYAGNLHFRYDMTEQAEESMVPAMSVLTFVENSIKYSTDFSEDLIIGVMSRTDHGEIIIEIRDNCGKIPEDILEKIHKNEKIVKDDREHIGIKNIVDRMYMHYGEAGKVTVVNLEEGGVCVTLRMPELERENEAIGRG